MNSYSNVIVHINITIMNSTTIPQININHFNTEVLEYILSLNKDLEQSNYELYSIRLSTEINDESDIPYSIWELSIEDLVERTTTELKTSLELILNADNEGEVKIVLNEDNFYDIQYIIY